MTKWRHVSNMSARTLKVLITNNHLNISFTNHSSGNRDAVVGVKVLLIVGAVGFLTLPRLKSRGSKCTKTVFIYLLI
jgi:hypothetical protein